MRREELIEQFLSNQQTVIKVWKLHLQKSLGENSLTHAQLGALLSIYQEQPISGRELAIKMQISRSAVTQVVDALDQSCLIERYEDEDDRRITYIRVSEQGRCKVQEFEKARNQLLKRTASALSDDELQTMIAINKKIIKELEA